MTHRLNMVATTLAGIALVLAGCGSQAEMPVAAGNAPAGAEPAGDQAQLAKQEQDKRNRAENMVADCMKQQGFTYIPHAPAVSVGPPPSVRGQNPALVSYEDLKTFRQKYGFGVYAADVYPQDPNVASRQATAQPNPNEAIKAGLDPARKQAYSKALYGEGKGTGGCVGASMKAVFGEGRATTDDAAKQAEARQIQLAFESDPGVLQAAHAYASCLSSRGHKVSSAKPGMIEESLRQELVTARGQGQGNLAAGAARTALDNEIRQALDDLECGKDYFVAAKPFVTKLRGSGVG